MRENLRDYQKPYAIVIGLESMQGIQTARILADRKVPVIAIAKDKNNHACRTRVCEKILVPDQEAGGTIHLLETLGPQLSQKAVLFPCTDGVVRLISRHRQQLEPWYHTVLPDPEVVEKLMDKVEFYTFAQKEGFPIPATRILYSRQDAEEASKQINFPCVLKPPSRSGKWAANTKLKAFKASSPDELLGLYNKYHQWAEALIVQEWVDGTAADLYSCNCYFDANAQPLVTFVARKLRQWPPKTGQSSLGEECRNDVVLNETIRLFRSVNYRGLGYVEMKRDVPSGNYYIIEPNIGRPTGRSAIAEAGGVELLHTMYCDAVGLPLPENREQKYGNVKWIHLRRDTQSALYAWRHKELTVKEWWQSLRGRKAYALFSWRDPMPFVADLLETFKILFSSTERKKRGL